MNLTLISATLTAAIGFGAAWQIQSWRADAKELDYANTRISEANATHALKERNLEALVTAQNQATERNARLTRNSDAARRDLDGLRNISALAVQAARTDPASCIDTASTQAVVLSECSDRLVEVARDADGHANDTSTMIEAWPK